MPKLVPLKAKQLIDKLKKLGYKGPIYGGRHAHMIIRELGISREDFIDL